MGPYLHELGLCAQEMYDAQGNSFDPQAVAIRIWTGLHGWAAGNKFTRHMFPPMNDVVAAYGEVRGYVEGRGLVGCLRPSPHDLHDGRRS